MLEDGHVAADLTEAAEGDDSQPSLGKGRGGFQLGVRMTHTVTVPGERDRMIHCLWGPVTRRAHCALSCAAARRSLGLPGSRIER
ncbi:hypothetical protein GCM10010335_00470 [Streptomyces galbus]|nr:hypothetical protein GCM10010335_00470 [Streptomyces galbus]